MSAPDSSASAGRTALAACSTATTSYLDEQLAALMRSVRDSQLRQAGDKPDPETEERLFAVVEEVQGLLPAVKKKFLATVLEGLRHPDDMPHPLPQEPVGDDPGRLSLVETSRVDDWLRMRRILGRQKPEAQAVEEALWERLAAAAGVPAEEDGCPVSLQNLCVHFQASLQDVHCSREARAAIYDAFEDTVVKKLGALVVALDAALDAK
jgi:hypothetical protein